MSIVAGPSPGGRRRLRMGRLSVDVLAFAEAVDAIDQLVQHGQGGAVYTPNVDHVIKALSNDAFTRAYEAVDLSLADGMPLVWAARLLGCPLPGRVAGSDLLIPLLERAAQRRWRVYILGSIPEVVEPAAALLRERTGVSIVGWDCPRIGPDGSDLTGGTIARASAARADLILVALGPPKQEILIHRAAKALRPAVSIGIGASLDFVIGRYRRAPRWAAEAGLEWAFRLAQEPRRLWRRYLLEGPRFAAVVLQMLKLPRSQRIQGVSAFDPATVSGDSDR